MVQPFTLDVPQADLDDLADHWAHAYDWRRHEAELNALPQFTTEIDGRRVHFPHVRSANPDALPLVLVHGRPGSVIEFLDLLEPLSPDFHLVIPSIPGFDLSGPTTERGWDVHRVARAFTELMRRLGHNRHGTQGGDWGSGIAQAMAAAAPDHVVAAHVDFLPTKPVDGVALSEEDERRLDRIKARMRDRPGYRVLQATRPQTISYALTDSPVGQPAWIAEKFSGWTDPDSAIGVDRLLTDVMLYWLTGTAGSSARLTRETGTTTAGCSAPLGVAVFAHDIVLPVRPLAEDIRRFFAGRS
ncbi:epoxide hydrolase [Saccharothrix sp. HUAS TT1]|uniref:epoxide hydrolase family protein n=1 Tax=unclassified Saccharothrix TaxID=2593673 RepID=UPI00345B93F3